VILDVDLDAFEHGGPEARRAVVDGVMRSLGTGFVFCSHDLPGAELDEAYDLLGRFFDLPLEAKRRWTSPDSHGQTGYTAPLVETAAGAEVADWKEMLNWGRSLPANHPLRRRFPHQYSSQVLPEDDVPGITAVLTRFAHAVEDLQRRVLRVIGAGLGVESGFFDSIVGDGATLSRAIHYPPMADAPTDGSPRHVWAAEHGDINLITALPRATGPGLQVWVGGELGGPTAGVAVAGEWIDAIPPDDHVVLNTGMMLERLTNGVLPAGIHRVVAAPGQTGDRLSVVQFLHPSPATILAPLASCIDDRRPQRWAPIEAGAWLDQVLWDINLIERS
jgi:isopenicillin N synthase-like dioxygenase